jgi:clan AA aspartic protease
VKGEVDSLDRALIALKVRSRADGEPNELTAWVDTAFTGELVIPRETIAGLGLPQSATVMAGLADGTEVVLETYSCVIDWFDQQIVVEVIGNEGQLPLLGVGLLRDRKLEIDYRARMLVIE